MIEATCLNGVVKDADETIIPDAEIQSEGVAESSGVALIEKGKVVYFAKISEDLKTTITKLSTALQNIDTQFIAMAAYGGAACNTSLITELNTLKENLK